TGGAEATAEDTTGDATGDAEATPARELLEVVPAEPDDLERQLAQDEQMERQTRQEHHEAPHFRREND
ncbi:MAG: hypothetical protein ACRDYB_14610, partial [Acidimicrobiales bacterium]